MAARLATDDLLNSLLAVERWSRDHDYAGFCKFDALNAPLLESLAGRSSWGRLITTQIVNRIPLPLRSWLSVPPRRNPKGIANFIKAYCALHRSTGSPLWLEKARGLADWLLLHDSRVEGAYPGSGRSWGYHFPWQSPGFYAPRHSPNCIVTVFCGEALLAVSQLTSETRYAQAAIETAAFLQKDLPILEETPDRKCIGYVPSGPRWKVININAVTAGFLAKLSKTTGDRAMMREARRLVAWTMSVRHQDYSWDYTSPKNQSGIPPDNYHTGGILDGILDYTLASGDTLFLDDYRQALAFYERQFFTAEGAPRWRANRTYPIDIHGAAQGILTFTKAAEIDPHFLGQAQRTARWTVENMQDRRQGRFYYQKFPGFIWKLDLMRWSNSWMAWALAELCGVTAGTRV